MLQKYYVKIKYDFFHLSRRTRLNNKVANTISKLFKRKEEKKIEENIEGNLSIWFYIRFKASAVFIRVENVL